MTWKRQLGRCSSKKAALAFPQAFSTQKFDVKALARVIKDRI